MFDRAVYSVCGMCAVNCPIEVFTAQGRCRFIQGHRQAPGIRGSLCPRGAAGLAILNDDQRPQFPLVREGERGAGRWRRVGWDEALDLAAHRIEEIRQAHGARSLMLSDAGGPFSDLDQALIRGLGSPNYFDDASARNLNTDQAAHSLFGFGSDGLVCDFKRARMVVLQTRNLFESVHVQQLNHLLDAMERGCRLTVIDVRASVGAAKADRFLMVRPGSDLALNQAVLHLLLKNDLYKRDFVVQHLEGLDELKAYVENCTPEWAAQETGVAAEEIVDLARDLAQYAPAVIWHPGWMTARYHDSFMVARTAYLINALLGSIGAPGGLPLSQSPEDLGRRGLNRLVDLYPLADGPRVDRLNKDHPHLSSPGGLLHLGLLAMASGQPYAVKGYLACQHDPLGTYPDQKALGQALANLDLLLCITPTWSRTAWLADIVLPCASYLESDSIVGQVAGLTPRWLARNRGQDPAYETLPDWRIICALAGRLGLDKLAFTSIEDIRAYQLRDTGVMPNDLALQGFVDLIPAPLSRPSGGPRFATASGKIEVVSTRWQAAGLDCLIPFRSRAVPPSGSFCLTLGRSGLERQDCTVNNPMLQLRMPENSLWLNADKARSLGLANGDRARVTGGGASGQVQVTLSEFIHPEAAFLVHGFGQDLPPEARVQGRGLDDGIFLAGGLERCDQSGGGLALQEVMITVSKP